MTAAIDNSDSWVIPPPLVGSVSFHSCDTQARMDIGDCSDTSLAVLMLLTEDANADVRFGLAENHNIDESVLNKLAEDSNPYVASRAQQTLARLKFSADKVANYFAAQSSRHPSRAKHV